MYEINIEGAINVAYASYSIRIKELRENAGLKQSGLGSVLGLGQSAIASWESGASKPQLDAIIKMAEYFNVSAGYIIGIEDKHGQSINAGYDSVKHESIRLSDDEKKLIRRFRRLDDESQEELLFRALELVRRNRDFTPPDESSALIS